MRKLRFIARKEIYHILRDPRSLIIVFAMPLLMTLLYGYAINLDIENITLAVVDLDQTAHSRQLIGRFFNSTYFSEPDEPVNMADPEKLLRSGTATAVLVIKPGFSDAVTRNDAYELGMIVDGSDNALALAVQAYSKSILTGFLADLIPPGQQEAGVTVSSKVLYNPDLKSSHFFVPGLAAVILMMISALLTSITIAREKETGTMEQLLTAPVTPGQILLGKLLPYVVIAFLDGLLVIVFARIVFEVPFVGSELLLVFFTFVYVSTALSIGILISSLVKTQQVAMMLAMVTTMLPSVMLSGFIFALKNMPLVLQAVSYIIPARYYLIVIRGIMLKGAGLTELAFQGGYLIILLVVFLAIAMKRFTVRIA